MSHPRGSAPGRGVLRGQPRLCTGLRRLRDGLQRDGRSCRRSVRRSEQEPQVERARRRVARGDEVDGLRRGQDRLLPLAQHLRPDADEVPAEVHDSKESQPVGEGRDLKVGPRDEGEEVRAGAQEALEEARLAVPADGQRRARRNAQRPRLVREGLDAAALREHADQLAVGAARRRRACLGGPGLRLRLRRRRRGTARPHAEDEQRVLAVGAAEAEVRPGQDGDPLLRGGRNAVDLQHIRGHPLHVQRPLLPGELEVQPRDDVPLVLVGDQLREQLWLLCPADRPGSLPLLQHHALSGGLHPRKVQTRGVHALEHDFRRPLRLRGRHRAAARRAGEEVGGRDRRLRRASRRAPAHPVRSHRGPRRRRGPHRHRRGHGPGISFRPRPWGREAPHSRLWHGARERPRGGPPSGATAKGRERGRSLIRQCFTTNTNIHNSTNID